MGFEDVQFWIASYGYFAIFLLLMVGIVGLPVPDETLLVLVGLLVLKGTLHPLTAFLCAWGGSVCGISMSYLLGRFGGALLIQRYGARLHYSEDRVRRVQSWFNHGGKWLLLIGYYVPGVRHLIAFVAGSSRLRPPIFCLFAYSGAFLWVLTFMGIGYFFGKEWQTWSGEIHLYIGVGTAMALLLAAIYFWRRGKISPE